jgi:hypothetical protein
MFKLLFSVSLLVAIAAVTALPQAPQPTPPAQPAPNPSDLCTIQGSVLKAGTGEPIHKAIVQISPVNGKPLKGQPQIISTQTDLAGRFEIKDIPPGEYSLWAQRAGFLRQYYRQRGVSDRGTTVSLSKGEVNPQINFQLLLAGAIAGHVYDEDGDPVMSAMVVAYQYNYSGGLRQLQERRQQRTNDLGEFRLFSMPPGQYFVAAKYDAVPTNDQTHHGYVPIYYPGVADAGRAAPIIVRGGEDFSGVDIDLQPIRTVTVKGHLVTSACGGLGPNASVIFNRPNFGPISSQGAEVSDTGDFTMPGIAPGSYYLMTGTITDGRACVCNQSLEVGDTDVDGITLVLLPTLTVKGILHAEGQLASSSVSNSVVLHPRGTYAQFNPTFEANVNQDGTFNLPGVFDGLYEVGVPNLPENWFLKSARMDGVDVLASGVGIDLKQSPGSLDIVVSSNGAGLEGVVSNEGKPFEGALVTLVPDAPLRNQQGLYKTVTTDSMGHFALRGIAPGDYKVFAWEKVEPGAYASPEFLQAYENSRESVHITEGSRNTVNLDLIPAKDEGK